MSETLAERTFLAMYGFADAAGRRRHRPGRDASVAQGGARIRCITSCCRSGLPSSKSRIPVGGLREAVIRALLYAGMARGAVDERGFEAVRRIRQAHGDLPLSAFKALVREQFNMLLIDQEAALAAIPSMLPPDAETRLKAFDLIKQVLGARGEMSADDKERMSEVARLFGVDEDRDAGRTLSPDPKGLRREHRDRAPAPHEGVSVEK